MTCIHGLTAGTCDMCRPARSSGVRRTLIEGPGLCACGCGEHTHNEFAPGHDSKRRSDLYHAIDAGEDWAERELEDRNWPPPSDTESARKARGTR